MRKVWLTRPQADSDALAAELATHGIETIIAPVMEITPCTPPVWKIKPDALLLTSRHAAALLAMMPFEWRGLPVYCVGGGTGDVARTIGFNRVMAGDADVLALLPTIARELPESARVLYLAGEETRVDVRTLLAPHHIAVETVIAYRAQAVKKLSPALIEAFGADNIEAAVFFSPRSATLATELLTHHGITAANADAYCLSMPVAAAAGQFPWQRVHACHTPSRAAMVELLVSRLCAKVL